MLQNLRRFLLAVTLTAAVVAAPAGAATAAPGATDPGAIGVRLVDVPKAALDDPRARLYIVDHLAPGTTIKRRIEVTNTTAKTATLPCAHPAAATITGNAFLGAAGHTKNDLSTWTSVAGQSRHPGEGQCEGHRHDQGAQGRGTRGAVRRRVGRGCLGARR